MKKNSTETENMVVVVAEAAAAVVVVVVVVVVLVVVVVVALVKGTVIPLEAPRISRNSTYEVVGRTHRLPLLISVTGSVGPWANALDDRLNSSGRDAT